MDRAIANYISQWLKKAEEDLLVVNKLTEDEYFAKSTVCFHCQQAAEKYLKALLIANKREIKKTHNIEYLLSECEEIDRNFANINPGNLSDFGVEIRYPGDLYIPEDEEIDQHKLVVDDIKELVLENLKKFMPV